MKKLRTERQGASFPVRHYIRREPVLALRRWGWTTYWHLDESCIHNPRLEFSDFSQPVWWVDGVLQSDLNRAAFVDRGLGEQIQRDSSFARVLKWAGAVNPNRDTISPINGVVTLVSLRKVADTRVAEHEPRTAKFPISFRQILQGWLTAKGNRFVDKFLPVRGNRFFCENVAKSNRLKELVQLAVVVHDAHSQVQWVGLALESPERAVF